MRFKEKDLVQIVSDKMRDKKRKQNSLSPSARAAVVAAKQTVTSWRTNMFVLMVDILQSLVLLFVIESFCQVENIENENINKREEKNKKTK